MGKLFLTILILFLFSGCVMKEEYYSNKPTVAQSTYNMQNRCHNCTKYIESSEDEKTIIYLEDDIVYIEEVIYVEDKSNVTSMDDDYEVVYYINEKSENKSEPTYTEEVIYYYEEEL